MTEGWSAGLYRQEETVQIELEISESDKTRRGRMTVNHAKTHTRDRISRGTPG